MATTWVRLTGRVVASAAAVATLTGAVDNPAVDLATLTGTVSRARVDSVEARCIRSGYKVKLDGSWVPAADLVGELEVTESRDALTATASFGLKGSQWAPLATRTVWTRTPVEIWEINGPPGEELTRLRLAGYVRTCSPSTGPGPVIRVEVGDAGMIYEDQTLCHEIEPLEGLTRGEIVAEMAADLGIVDVDCPAGEVYTKAVQAINTRFGDWLRDFTEPELWWSEFTATGGLRCWRPVLRESPEPADEIWSIADGTLTEVEVEPPRDVPSRYVMRGFGAVHVDELGQETTSSVVEIWSIYAPARALTRQESDGSITDLGLSPHSPVLRLTQRLTDTIVRRGGLVLTQETTEEGYYNPREANKVTDPDNSELDYRTVLIDERGDFVAYSEERWMEKGRRRVTKTYDTTRTQTGETTEVYRWSLRTKGIQGVEDAAPSVFDAFVHGDGVSYSTAVEVYQLAERHVATRTFDATSGRETLVEVDSYGYYAPRAAVDPAVAGFYLLADGTAQIEITANWRQFARTETHPLYHEDGTTAGVFETKSAWLAPRVLDGYGFYSWGDADSVLSSERFQVTEIRREQINVLSTDSWERVTYRDGEEPQREIFSGRVPPPRYLQSPWTQLVQEPIEVVVDDPVLEAWFGFRREVLSNDYVQTLDEAERLVDELRARELAFKVRCRRHQALARIGSTVELRAPHQGLAHRGLVIQATTRRDLATGAQLGEYLLEVRT